MQTLLSTARQSGTGRLTQRSRIPHDCRRGHRSFNTSSRLLSGSSCEALKLAGPKAPLAKMPVELFAQMLTPDAIRTFVIGVGILLVLLVSSSGHAQVTRP